MQIAIELAREGMNEGKGGPFGCVIVKENEIIGKGSNCVSSTNDPTAHAEVVAIREACRNLKFFQLTGCEIFCSSEPCPMCLGAIYWARPEMVYFAGTRMDAAAAGFDDELIYNEIKVNYENRKIKMLTLGREYAIKVFNEWKNKEDKINY